MSERKTVKFPAWFIVVTMLIVTLLMMICVMDWFTATMVAEIRAHAQAEHSTTQTAPRTRVEIRERTIHEAVGCKITVTPMEGGVQIEATGCSKDLNQINGFKPYRFGGF